MKFVCSRVLSCLHVEEGNVVSKSIKEGGEFEHFAKVYPFMVTLPRYASWRSYVRLLLHQLKSCPHCQAAANAFPISSLPKMHTLPNGKVLVFKGLTETMPEYKPPDFLERNNNGAEDDTMEKKCSNPLIDSCNEPSAHHHQSLNNFRERGLEEYDMVSIDPNCSKHGRYSLTAWLQKEGAKIIGMKNRVICQNYSKTKFSQTHCPTHIKQVQKREEIEMSISSNFSKHVLEKDVIKKPLRVKVPSLKKHKNENFEFNVLKQIETNTTTKPSILFQKQSNILFTNGQQNNSILGLKQKSTLNVKNAHLNRRTQFNSEQGLSKTNDNKKMSLEITSPKSEKCKTLFEKDLPPISNIGLDKVTCKSSKTYAMQYKRMCHLKGLNYRNCFDGCNEAIEGDSKKHEHRVVSDMTIKSKISIAPQECVYEENDKLFSATRTKLRGDNTQSTSTTPTKFTRQEQLVAHDLFDMKELEQVEQRLVLSEHENGNLVNEIQISSIGEEPQTSTLAWFAKEHQTTCDMGAIEEREKTKELKCWQHGNESLVNETKIKLIDESSKIVPTWFSIDEHQMSSDICNLKKFGQSKELLECVRHENNNVVDETSICTLAKFTIEEQQMTSSIFDIKELEKTQERLEKIIGATKSLQLRLNDQPHCDDSTIEKVCLLKVQVPKRSEAQEWLSNMAIKRAANKIFETCQGGRVHQLVQAFESIK